MKRPYIFVLFLSFLMIILSGCSLNQPDPPEKVVDDFFKAPNQQNYASVKSLYSADLDNFANFRNQIEDISPSVATHLFDKMSDFSYTIKDSTIDPNDPHKATVNANILAYDLGNSFEATILDYIRMNLEMTFDGASSDDIIKKAEDVIVKQIDNSPKNFSQDVTVSLVKTKDTWELDKISENKTLINALSGNILATIDKLSSSLNQSSAS